MAGPGRPPGRSAKGEQSRDHLYKAALALIAERGYEAATMRDIAAAAGVSPGLAYKYFSSKQAIVLALYEQLTSEYTERFAQAAAGSWAERFCAALDASLEVLGPHRATLSSLTGVLVGDRDNSLFATGTAFSRQRVQQVFVDAVTSATDAPDAALAEPLGRLLYLAHLLIILWWLLDKSPDQRATAELVDRVRSGLGAASLALTLPFARETIATFDRLVRDALVQSS